MPRYCGQPPSCTNLTLSYCKEYRGVTFTASRTRIADENGYRVAVNADSTVVVAFTGSLTSQDLIPEPDITFSTFTVSLRYFNTRRQYNKHVFATAIVSTPLLTGVGADQYYVPVSLVGSLNLCPGIYQFDVLVTPLLTSPITTTVTDICDSDSDSDSDGDGHNCTTYVDDVVAPSVYHVFGLGRLSIEVARKAI